MKEFAINCFWFMLSVVSISVSINLIAHYLVIILFNNSSNEKSEEDTK